MPISITERRGNWVELKLIGVRSNRDAIGARITIEAGGMRQIREVDGGNGYAGESTRRVHFGLGKMNKLDRVEIRWPSGLKQQVTVPINRITYIEEGVGVVAR